MNILFLTSSFPYPPTDGIKIKVYHLLRKLSARHDLFLLSFYDAPSDIVEENVAQINAYCKLSSYVPRKRQHAVLIKIFLNTLGEELSFTKNFISTQFENRLNNIVKNENIDVVHFDGINLVPYLRSLERTMPTVVSPNDSLSLALKEEITHMPRAHLGWIIYRRLEYRNVCKYEKNNYPRFQKCYVVSELDKSYLSRLNKDIDVEAIPNGVDAEYFKPLGFMQEDCSLIYTGDMGGGGADYAIWFIQKTLPKVRKAFPHVKLYLVGKNASEKLRETAARSENIIVTGFVKDIRPFLDKATLSVSPVLKSCGMLNKVLEAMAMGKTVVGTKLSFSGISGCLHAENMIAVDTPDEFSDQIIHLLRNKELREKIGKNARLFVKNSYSWDETARRVEHLYQQAIVKFNVAKIKGYGVR